MIHSVLMAQILGLICLLTVPVRHLPALAHKSGKGRGNG